MTIEIRARHERITDRQRDFIERRLWFALSRFGQRIRRILVRLEDLNGPRGGLDKRCQVEVRFAGRNPLIADVRDVEFEPAVSRAAERIARQTRDELRKMQQHRQRGGRKAPAAPATED